MNRGVLLCAAGLHMATQSALAPFYPKLFREAFGVREFGATGGFLMVCQLAAIVALPLWGRATRHYPLARLVTAGQSAAVLLAASLALAPNFVAFTTLSVLLIAAKSVVLLAYPSIARSHAKGLFPGVLQYVAVLHAASIAATLLGTVVVTVPNPRTALPLLAVAELGLLCLLSVVGRRSADRTPTPATAVGRRSARRTPTPSPSTAVGRRSAGRWGSPLLERSRELGGGWAQPHDGGQTPDKFRLAYLAAVVLTYAVAVYAVRPYFTEYATAGGTSTQEAAFLFVLPHIAVLAVLPAATALRAKLGSALLPTSLALGAATLAWQAATTDPLVLGAARVLFGAALGLSQVALDHRVLKTSGESQTYSLIATAQTAGLLLAPLVATFTAKADLTGPLLAGAALLTLLALLTPTERHHPHEHAPRPRTPRRVAGVLARGESSAARQDPVGVRVRGTDQARSA
ncbi:MFS transporter [Streptomyces cavernicola]|uniref:MFS transporter n=1 Tax=Streptomyces cavernicola TaxID=3043613 RepID=A0ABT6S8B2_9ACTN|nr:hypothetical protein [Streptomyces sp. B-S-A6]MDI3404337.1 hypothetical protein [Streptomyces sp. B-S-A6]